MSLTLEKQRGNSKAFRVVWVALLMLPLLYGLSIGPMAPLLLYHGGDTGHYVWNKMYGDPLGKLPKSGRRVVNSYLSFSDRMYWKLRNWMED